MSTSISPSSLPPSAVAFGLVSGIAVGATIGAASIVLGISEPPELALEGRSLGLAMVASFFGGWVGAAGGLVLGLVIWRLDAVLVRWLPYWRRSLIEASIITAVTGISASVVYTGLSPGLVVRIGLVGALCGAAAAALYFTVRLRQVKRTTAL